MGKKPNGTMMIGIGLSILAVACEIFSIAAFYGLGAGAWPVCGSACEVWPGIPTGQVCVLMCVLRNGAYLPSFYAGLATGCVSAGVIVAGAKSARVVSIGTSPAAR